MTAALLGPDEMVKPQPERTPLDADPGHHPLWCPPLLKWPHNSSLLSENIDIGNASPKARSPHDPTAVSAIVI